MQVSDSKETTLSIIIIGDEILLGQVTDTNSGAIARAFGAKGWRVVETMVVGDDRQQILEAVEHALAQSTLVITTGGLGPTKDDITKRVLLEVFGGSLQEDPAVKENVERVFAKRGLKMNDLTLSQAMVPTSCQVIQNQFGTAPVMWFERDGKVLISMPGVPFETEGMLKAAVVDEVCKRFASGTEYFHHTVVAFGLPESALAQHLDAYERTLPGDVHLAYLPVPGYIRLRLDGSCPAAFADSYASTFDEYVTTLKAQLGSHLLCDGDKTPAEVLLDMLRERHLSVSSAESCTGGNIAHMITSIAGSSDCYYGSVVSYSNSVKMNVLGVGKLELDTFGAVSEPVVRQMAEGAARVIGTDCSMATSGIAGPGGGTPEKPVGTVWMAVHTPAGTVSKVMRLPGSRERVIDRATTEVILMLIEELRAEG